MGLLDGLLGGILENAISSHPGGLSGLMSQALANFGGLDGIVNQLNQAGLGQKVNSWLGKGENVPLTADEINAVLSSSQLQQIAAQLGVSADQVPHLLAAHLPQAIDQASPDGVLVNPN
jgi:uncharacterized protein YidB (DUF937 family)